MLINFLGNVRERSLKNLNFCFTKIKYNLYVLILKIIFKKYKNIIDMYFGTKSYLKITRNHTS
jgi:hypothetical protein